MRFRLSVMKNDCNHRPQPPDAFFLSSIALAAVSAMIIAQTGNARVTYATAPPVMNPKPPAAIQVAVLVEAT